MGLVRQIRFYQVFCFCDIFNLSGPSMENVILVRNSAETDGGGMYLINSVPDALNGTRNNMLLMGSKRGLCTVRRYLIKVC